MKAAILRAVNAPLTIEDVDVDDVRQDEVRIRVVASGLCHSDYHSMVGDVPTAMPAILGHEASGIVEAVGSGVTDLKPGDHVVTCTSSYCGRCRDCQGGHNYVCEYKPRRPAGGDGRARVTQGGEPVHQYCDLGGFAETMLVHRNSLARLPEGMPMDRAALLGCAVLTGIGTVTHGAAVRPGSTVVVLGCGGVGLNVIQGARLAGAARIVAVDTNPAKLALARKFGATDCVAGGDAATATVVEITRGGADYVFEVIGIPAVQRQGLMMLRRRGKLVLVGIAPATAAMSLPALLITARELQVVGSLMGSVPFQTAVPAYAQLYLDGRIELDALISQRIGLNEINEGYRKMVEGEVARSVIMFDA